MLSGEKASIIKERKNSNSPALTEVNDSRNETDDELNQIKTELTVRFVDEGEPHLYDNDTTAIARYVETSDWRLPIYHYDDYDNWEVMKYYDIPSVPEQVSIIRFWRAGETKLCRLAMVSENGW